MFARAARVYWLDVFPVARRELRHWRGRAQSIPDPGLRRDALFTHRTKSRHAEGLAVFAVLAPATHRRSVVRATVAFELILDYLDTISEQGPLENSLQLHRAFDVALDPALPPEDYYALHPRRDDDGYLAAKVDACREALRTLPSYPALSAALRRRARLTRRAQSLNHAIPFGLAEEEVAAWARETAAEVGLESELRWWEMIAAGCSSVALGTAIAAAADPRLAEEEVARIESAYFPWVAALNTLLDSLVDLDGEPFGVNHLNRYAGRGEAAERLAAIASRAIDLARELPQAELHELIVAAVGGYYLAQPSAWLPDRAPIARRVLAALGPYARLALATHCIRQARPRSAVLALRPGAARMA